MVRYRGSWIRVATPISRWESDWELRWTKALNTMGDRVACNFNFPTATSSLPSAGKLPNSDTTHMMLATWWDCALDNKTRGKTTTCCGFEICCG